MIIAIDGPAASGKGTLAKRLAEIYRLRLLDTGSLYRAVALAMLDAGLDPRDQARAGACAAALDPAHIDGQRIRANEVGVAASFVAAHAPVRAALLAAQRRFAAAPEGAILEGRDIGAVVCPDADVKLFVTASLAVRAARRQRELAGRGQGVELALLQAQIAERDERDATRALSPLRQAGDAHLLDTTHLSIEETVAAACRFIDAVRPPS